jgi:uncharacterized membrane protein YdjX (TVP38/TMEM64 family)
MRKCCLTYLSFFSSLHLRSNTTMSESAGMRVQSATPARQPHNETDSSHVIVDPELIGESVRMTIPREKQSGDDVSIICEPPTPDQLTLILIGRDASPINLFGPYNSTNDVQEADLSYSNEVFENEQYVDVEMHSAHQIGEQHTEQRSLRRYSMSFLSKKKSPNSSNRRSSDGAEATQCNNRIPISTSSLGAFFWDDNALSHHQQHENNDDDEERKQPYCFCYNVFLRALHRICRPHVNAPKCLNRCNINNRMQPQHRRIMCRSIIIIVMIVTITFTLLDLLILHRYLNVWLSNTLDWLFDNPVAGGIAFIGIFLVGSLCFFPVALLSLGAGYVYIELYGLGLGIVASFLVCYFGCLLGAAVCFARSRYLMRQLIQKFSNRYPIVRAVDKAFETKGLRLFLLLRLSPAMPFNALNYIGGITAVAFRDYWWATCLGIIPGLLWTIFGK